MNQAEHAALQELLGVYVLHAVDDDERAAVDAHLETCPKCRAEVDGLREVTAHLAQAGAPAPEGVWARIAAEIASEGDVAPPPLRLVVDQPAPARTRRWLAPVLAAAAAAIVAVGGVQLATGGADGPVGGTQGPAILAAPEARQTLLTTSDGVQLAHAAVLPDGSGYLVADQLPDLDAGVYQLWGQSDGGAVVSLGVLDPAGESIAFSAQPDVAVLMITAEDAPVAATANTPVVVGELA